MHRLSCDAGAARDLRRARPARIEVREDQRVRPPYTWEACGIEACDESLVEPAKPAEKELAEILDAVNLLDGRLIVV